MSEIKILITSSVCRAIFWRDCIIVLNCLLERNVYLLVVQLFVVVIEEILHKSVGTLTSRCFSSVYLLLLLHIHYLAVSWLQREHAEERINFPRIVNVFCMSLYCCCSINIALLSCSCSISIPRMHQSSQTSGCFFRLSPLFFYLHHFSIY